MFYMLFSLIACLQFDQQCLNILTKIKALYFFSNNVRASILKMSMSIFKNVCFSAHYFYFTIYIYTLVTFAKIRIYVETRTNNKR